MNNPHDIPCKDVDHDAIRRAVRDILAAVGEDPDREGLMETPARVARLYAEMFAGLGREPNHVLEKRFTEKYDEVVLVKDIAFCSMCEHHLLPFVGTAHVGYIPDGQVVGISKVARVVDIIARRPQVQERMTQQIACVIEEELHPRGVAVVMEATHTCMTIRGVRKANAIITTSTMLGLFRRDLAARGEIMTLIYGKR